jgi:nicotinate-nucleotide adenylyltransferase
LARVGILGGTFDPPHNGHIGIAQAALKEFRLDRVIFVPACVPPHKMKRCVAPAEDRFKMLQLAINGHEKFEISRIELDRPGPSYTADTLTEFRKTYPYDELFLLIGADNIAEIESWHEPDRIVGLAKIAAANRPNFTASGAYTDRVVAFKMPPADISSTVIRKRVKTGLPITDLVPPGVEDYIIEHRLYRSE